MMMNFKSKRNRPVIDVIQIKFHALPHYINCIGCSSITIHLCYLASRYVAERKANFDPRTFDCESSLGRKNRRLPQLGLMMADHLLARTWFCAQFVSAPNILLAKLDFNGIFGNGSDSFSARLTMISQSKQILCA
jgi:hypothetical protein